MRVYYDGVHFHGEQPNNTEFTICGWAFDAPETEDDCPLPFLKHVETIFVTCPDCITIIKEIKKIHTKLIEVSDE